MNGVIVMNELQGLPIIFELDKYRKTLYHTSHDDVTDTVKQISCWFGHKVFTVITVPANVLEIGLSLTGAVASSCTVGVFKIAVFAFTLGNYKIEHPTGFTWFGERVVHGIREITINIGELIYDVANIVYRILERIVKGIAKAAEAEEIPTYEIQAPLNLVEDATAPHRIDFNSEERSLQSIFDHYLLSCINIPLNATIAVGGAGIATIFSAIFISKAALYATTNINVPIPTCAGQALFTTIAATDYVVRDVVTDLADVPVLLYKVSTTLKIYDIIVSPLRVIMYIPEALFS